MPRIKKQVLKRRKDGRYCCKYHGIQFMGNTSDEALALREAYKKQEQQGIFNNDHPTVFEYAQKWLPIAKPKVADSTYVGLVIHLENLCSMIGESLMENILPLDIKEVYSVKYKSCSNSYIQSAKQIYVAMFDSAVANGICKINPAKDKTALPHKGEEGGHRAITDQEREWINTYCHDHRAFPAVITMLYEGIRPAEAKAMNIDSSVDFKSGRVYVHEFAHKDGYNHYSITDKGKTKKAVRDIPLFSPVREALKDKHGLLIKSADGKPISITGWRCVYNSYVHCMETAINGVDKRWYGRTKEHKQILQSGGTLPPWQDFTVKPYDLRHSFCAYARDHNVELKTMISWMGHSDAQMILKIYDEVSDKRDRNEAEKLEKALFRMQNGMQDENHG